MKNISYEVKTYYLPGYRSVVIGGILILMGVGISFIGFDPGSSAWENFQGMVLDFRDIANFMASLLMLFFKALFIVLGYFSIRNSGKVARAKLDHKGIHFKEMVGKTKYERALFDLGAMSFVPYTEITGIQHVKNLFFGHYLTLETTAGIRELIPLAVLTRAEREEIYKIVCERMRHKGRQQPKRKNNAAF